MSGDKEKNINHMLQQLLSNSPPFWPSDPNIWFGQVEVLFATRGITSQRTMFEYVVASLPPDIATEICNLILSPPIEIQYTNLKEKLIQRTAAS